MPYLSKVFFPKLSALEVVAKNTGRTVPDDHARAIGHRGGRAVGVGSVRRLNGGKLDRPLPPFLAGPAVEAVQVSLLSLVFRTGDENAAARNDRAAVAGTWKGRLPTDVF